MSRMHSGRKTVFLLFVCLSCLSVNISTALRAQTQIYLPFTQRAQIAPIQAASTLGGQILDLHALGEDFVACVGGSVQVFGLDGAGRFVRKGHSGDLEGRPGALAVHGDRALLLLSQMEGGSQLALLSLADRTQPRLLRRIPIPGRTYFHDLVFDGRFAYVLGQDPDRVPDVDVIRALDLEDARRPEHIVETELPAGLEGTAMTFAGRWLLVYQGFGEVDEAGRLLRLDRVDPLAPRLNGALDLPSPMGPPLVADANQAYINHHDVLHLVDLRPTDGPRLASRFEASTLGMEHIGALTLSQNGLYLLDRSRLHRFELPAVGRLEARGSVAHESNRPQALAAAGGRAVVADERGLEAFWSDVARDRPDWRSRHRIPTDPSKVWTAGDQLLVVDDNSDAILSYSLAEPGDPAYLGETPIGFSDGLLTGKPRVDGALAWIRSSRGLFAVDSGIPGRPRLRGPFSLSGTDRPASVGVRGTRLAAASYDDNRREWSVRSYDITGLPEAPPLVAEWLPAQGASELHFLDDHHLALLFGDRSGVALSVYDLSNPDDPRLVAEERRPSWGWSSKGVLAQGRLFVALSDARKSLGVMDMRDPARPQTGERTQFGREKGSGLAIATDGARVFLLVSDRARGMELWSLEASRPRVGVMGHQRAPGHSYHMAAREGWLYLSRDGYGLRMMQQR